MTTCAAAGLWSTDLLGDAPVAERGATQIGGPVVPYIFDGDLRDLPTSPRWKPGAPLLELPIRGGGMERSDRADERFVPHGHSKGRPGRTGQRPAKRSMGVESSRFSELVLDIAGQSFAGHPAPDTVGDVGPGHYIQAVNTSDGVSVVVLDKVGATLAGPFQLDSLGSGHCAFGEMDPTVLYDRLADRWLLSELSSVGERLCVYVSRTGDPVGGGWFAYDFQTVDFPDFGNLAVWSDAYYGSSNEDLPAVYAFDRLNMLLGAPARPAQRFTASLLAGFVGFQALTPADHDGSAPPPLGAPGIFLRHVDDEAHRPHPDPDLDLLELYFFGVDFDNAAASTFSGPFEIPIDEIDSTVCGLLSFRCFDQPGGGPGLAPLHQTVFHRLQYVNHGSHETLVSGLVTDIGGDQGGLRWLELRRTAGDWGLFQEGTYGADSADRWMGSIAQDRQGNIAIGYNVVDETASVFPGIRYAGRLANDPLGTLPRGEHSIIEGSARNSTNRYGDYSTIGVDPSDDCTFWFTGEFNQSADWSTRIAAFRFDGCEGPPAQVPSIVRTAGACPGQVTISGHAFSPYREVALVEASSLEGFVKTGSICAGALFEIGEPFRLPPHFAVTDGDGSFSITLSMTAGHCLVEAIDLNGSCATSNAIDVSP